MPGPLRPSQRVSLLLFLLLILLLQVLRLFLLGILLLLVVRIFLLLLLLLHLLLLLLQLRIIRRHIRGHPTPSQRRPDSRFHRRSGRGSASDDWNPDPSAAGPRDLPPRTGRYGPDGSGGDSYANGAGPRASAYGRGGPGPSAEASSGFGARRRDKDEGRRGTRPSASSSADDMPRSGRRPASGPIQPPGGAPLGSPALGNPPLGNPSLSNRGAVPQGSPIAGASPYGSRAGAGQEPGLGNRPGPLGAAPRSNQTPLGRTGSPRSAGPGMADAEFRPLRQDNGGASPSPERPLARGEGRPSGPSSESGPGASGNAPASAPPRRDNSSRFDD